MSHVTYVTLLPCGTSLTFTLPAASDGEPASNEWDTLATRWRQEVAQPLVEAFQALGQEHLPIAKNVWEITRTINGVVWDAYLEDGAIYGETSEGMLRWLKERRQHEQLKQQAELLVFPQQDARYPFRRRQGNPES